MSQQAWEDTAPAELEGFRAPTLTPPAERPSLISLRFVGSAIRRRRAAIALCALLGLIAGVAVAELTSVKQVATASVLLTRDPTLDADRAAATDVALAQTDEVAGTVANELKLSMTPAQFAKTITVTKVTDDVLRISVSGPNAAAAKLRANDVVTTFLAFRAKTLARQSNAIVDGLRDQVKQLNALVADLTTRINAADSTGTTTLSDLVSQRTQATTQINTLENQIDADVLATSSITSTSRMLDPATTQATSKHKRLAVDAAGGLIVGALLAMLVVVVAATLSWRVRRREDAADAVDAPVRSVRSARKLSPAERYLLVRLVEQASEGGKAVAWIANGTVKLSARLLVTVARELQAKEHNVLLVDLAPGRPLRRLAGKGRRARPLNVLTPAIETVLESGPLFASRDLVEPSQYAAAYAEADIVLVLATVDPAVGAEYFREWAEAAIVTVGTGECTPENLHTTAELLRTAGVFVEAAVLMQADRNDESLGAPVGAAHAEALVRSVAP